MTQPSPDPYRLSPEEHDRIFLNKIVPIRLQRHIPWREPTAILLAGQPGAGKSRAKAAVVPFKLVSVSEAPRGGAVDLSADKLRTYHPSFRALMITDDQTAATQTAADASRWTREALAFAIAQRNNLVLDSTLSRHHLARQTINDLRAAGYRIEVAFVAAPAALSLLGNLERYYGQVETLGHGRICPRPVHDEAYVGLLKVADSLDEWRNIDAVHVYRRGGERIYSNHLTIDGEWVTQPETRQAIETERSRTLTRIEAERALASIERVRENLDPVHAEELAYVEGELGQLLPADNAAEVALENGDGFAERQRAFEQEFGRQVGEHREPELEPRPEQIHHVQQPEPGHGYQP